MRAILWLLLAAVVTTAGAAARPAGTLDWAVYHNERFGLDMRYPADVFSERRTSEAGDGDLFTTPDGRAKLLIGALENTDGYSPPSYQRFIAREIVPRFAGRLCTGSAKLVGIVGHAW